MSDATPKPKVRVPAGSDKLTKDSFQNFSASLGYGANNLTSASQYGFNPLTRNHTQLEWAYRGSWLIKKVVDAPAEDMTRAGITIDSTMTPDDIKELDQYTQSMQLWQDICTWIKWSRLYGGAVAYMVIEGQDPMSPLRMETVGKNQFKGLLIMDRWMVWPHIDDPIKELGADYGKPRYYDVVTDARMTPKMKMHHSRVLRLEGLQLPYWQQMSENGWGMSVVEPLYDRLIAFDSATTGAAQLVYRAHLRTLKIERYRELIAFGGTAYQAMLQQLQLIRLMQANEGLTVLDSTDEFESHQYAFGGVADMINQFGQQLSGASDIPLTRLFGQSPNGMSATGESDMRNYYDAINAQQESRLRKPITILLSVAHRSCFGYSVPEGFTFTFDPLWQLTETEKGELCSTITTSIDTAMQSGIVGRKTALEELKQSSKITGIWSNIRESDINAADNDPPPIQQAGGEGQSAAPGQSSVPAPNKAEGSELPKAPESDDDATVPIKAPKPTLRHKADVFRHFNKKKTNLKNIDDVREHFNIPGGFQSKEHVAQAYPDKSKQLRTIQEVKDYFNNLINTTAAQESLPPAHPEQVNQIDYGPIPPDQDRYEFHIHPLVKAEPEPPQEDKFGYDTPPGPNQDRYEFHIQDHAALQTKDVNGIPVIIETEKGGHRTGYGWSDAMPCDYGYISSNNEQMNCFVGPNTNSNNVYVIEQMVDVEGVKQFDKHKVMLGFDSRDDALHSYLESHSDIDAGDKVGKILSMDTDALTTFLKNKTSK